jgi:hypothetical protein
MSGESTSFRAYLKAIKLSKDAAQAAQRIGTLPPADLEKAFADARKHDILSTYDDLIQRARPYWYKASREKKHRSIRQKAFEVAAKREAAMAPTPTRQAFGPFPLLYADPPWKFEIYSEKGLERTADQHYPTLTDEEIINFKIRSLRDQPWRVMSIGRRD